MGQFQTKICFTSMIALTHKPRLTGLPNANEPHARHWVSDVSELCKARITFMVLITTAVGFLLGWRGPINLLSFVQTLCGTALAASGAAALNQVFEVELAS